MIAAGSPALLWGAYAAGTAAHWILKASACKAARESPVRTRREWLRANWRALLTRFLLATALFAAWAFDPGLSSGWLGFSLNPGSAFLYGYLADNALYLAAAKFPLLNGRVPEYRP